MGARLDSPELYYSNYNQTQNTRLFLTHVSSSVCAHICNTHTYNGVLGGLVFEVLFRNIVQFQFRKVSDILCFNIKCEVISRYAVTTNEFGFIFTERGHQTKKIELHINVNGVREGPIGASIK